MKTLGKWIISARARTPVGARRSFSVLVVAAVSAAGLAAVAGTGPAGAAATRPASHHHAVSSGTAGDETTVSQNDLRNGWDANEPTLTPRSEERRVGKECRSRWS